MILSLVLIQTVMLSFSTQAQRAEVKNAEIVWKGYKVTGSHDGTVGLKSGWLDFKDDHLSGGEFVIDMTNMTCTDMEGEYADKLVGHLKSDDFFGVDKHPNAKLNINSVKSSGKNAVNITADLTIKGVTKQIEFPASIYGNKATANLKIDRTLYGIKYGSGSYFDGLKDKMIYDEFDLVIDIEF